MSDAVRFENVMADIDSDHFFFFGISSSGVATCAPLFWAILADVEAGIEDVRSSGGSHCSTLCQVLFFCLSYFFVHFKFDHARAIAFE